MASLRFEGISGQTRVGKMLEFEEDIEVRLQSCANLIRFELGMDAESKWHENGPEISAGNIFIYHIAHEHQSGQTQVIMNEKQSNRWI